MDLVNQTPFNARFLNGVVGEDRMLGAVIARATYRIEDGVLVATPDEPWPIDMSPMETPYGKFPGDLPFLTGGIDVFVVGNAYQPDGQARPTLRVQVRVGSALDRSMVVFGDRYWKAEGDDQEQRKDSNTKDPPEEPKLVATEPKPFTVMALTYENAYGGKVQTDQGEMSWPVNPGGKGFALTAQQAAGMALPNLEDPDHLIRSYEDQPELVCMAPYPSDGSLKTLNALDLHLDDQEPGNSKIKEIKPLLFNAAHPKMIIDAGKEPRPGEMIEVTHVRPDGHLRFAMPDLLMHAHVQLEDRSYLFPLHLDQIGILAEDFRVFLSYRVVFNYRVVKMERRAATLYEGPLPEAVPQSYINSWQEEEVFAV